jgi:hypothetical protein
VDSFGVDIQADRVIDRILKERGELERKAQAVQEVTAQETVEEVTEKVPARVKKKMPDVVDMIRERGEVPREYLRECQTNFLVAVLLS